MCGKAFRISSVHSKGFDLYKVCSVVCDCLFGVQSFELLYFKINVQVLLLVVCVLVRQGNKCKKETVGRKVCIFFCRRCNRMIYRRNYIFKM
jgi:hypothetical protein